jgi:cellulose synthase/poly-beta-1,6-N-acetylglucosamine synthase-like glycosyltransferase
VTGEIVVTTDADTILDKHFIEEIIKPFSDSKVAAVGGYVKSIPYNWLTRCRAYDYAIGQNIHKLAQSYIGFMFVIPGAAGAFRLEAFKSYITFDHDTLTEDLDFTYKLHKRGQTIAYCRSAIVHTQDPSTLSGYVNQMRRWYGGGWQNLRKHWDLAINEPWASLELSLIYIEGLIFSLLMYAIPLIDAQLSIKLIVPYIGIGLVFGAYAAWRERRIDLTLAIFPYLFLMYVNAFVFVEQFVRVMLLGTRNLVWFKPERVEITS